MWLALILAAPASALSWWVPTDADADALRAALATAWPAGPIEVVVGPPAGEGLSYDGTALVLVEPEGVRRQPATADWATLVLLARSWTLTGETGDLGWVPPVPEIVPEPEPDDVPVPEPEVRVPLAWTWDFGAGLRDSWRESGHLEGPRLVARAWHGLLVLEADGYLATSTWSKTSGIDRTLLAIIGTDPDGRAELTQRIDTGTIATLAGIGPGPILAGPHHARIGPFVSAGLELRRTTERTLILTDASDADTLKVVLDPSSAAWRGGPLVHAGLEAGAGPTAVRLGVAAGTGGGAMFFDVVIAP
jgi:hypothetical protein